MLIDAFTWFNEAEMLLFRLKMLSPLVDRFVLVECDHIHSGAPKPYYSDRLDARFAPFRDKLIIHKMKGNIDGIDFSIKPTSYDETAASWQLEHQQREAISEACREFSDDALVLMGDVDEIPSREALTQVMHNNAGRAAPVAFGQFLFYYNLRFLRDVDATDPARSHIRFWKGTVLTTTGNLQAEGPQLLRDRRNVLDIINYGGWHLSYFKDTVGIRDKIEAMAHQEFNTDRFKDSASIERCIESGEDLFQRDMPIVRVKKEFFPPYFCECAPAEWW